MGDKVARLKQRDLLNQHYSKNQEEFRNKKDKFRALANQLGASSSESAQIRKKLAERALESSVANRNALMQRIRDHKLQVALVEARRPRGSIPRSRSSPKRSPTCGWRSRSNSRCWPIQITSA